MERGKISVKCPECESLLKKDTAASEEAIICQVCETQYKIVTTQNGKQVLEQCGFDGNDLGEL